MKKLLLSLLIACCTILNLAAMPCFESFISDTSGEYVYYRDNSFTRESYIGFLYYSDSTFQLRYYAPQDNNQLLLEKNIDLLITVDPNSDHLDMQGEMILSTILPGTEDADLVNYLHDMLYEFTARRSKMMLVSPTAAGYVSNTSWRDNGLKMNDDFAQFGGNVVVQYDAMVPLFNVKNIIGPDGSYALECVTFGQISSSEDETFSNFKGFVETENYSLSKAKNRAKTHKETYEGQSVNLDGSWVAQYENCWTRGDDAVLTLSSLPSFDDEPLFNINFIMRKLLYSANGSYTDLTKTELIYSKNNQIKINAYMWLPERESVIYNTKILTEKKSGDKSKMYNYFAMSVFKKPYQEHRAYFDKIISSYESK